MAPLDLQGCRTTPSRLARRGPILHQSRRTPCSIRVTDVVVDVTPVLDGEFQVDMSLVTTVGVCTLTESMAPAIAFTGGVVVGADANCSPCSPNTARTLNRALSAPTASPRVRWQTRRRLPCNRHDRLRTCWCVKAFRCNIARPAHFHAEAGRLRRRGRCGLGWGVSRTAWRRRNSRNARWYGYPMCTSTSGCCGSGGNETARSSAASPTRPRSAARNCAAT